MLQIAGHFLDLLLLQSVGSGDRDQFHHLHHMTGGMLHFLSELLVRLLHLFAEKKYRCRRHWNRHQEHDKHDPAVSQRHRQGNPDA